MYLKEGYPMTYNDCLKLYSNLLGMYFLNHIPPRLRERYMTILQQAEEKAKEHMDTGQLPILVGKRKAQRIVRRMQEDQLAD